MNIQLFQQALKQFLLEAIFIFVSLLALYIIILGLIAYVFMDSSLVVSGFEVVSMEWYSRALLLVPFLFIPIGVSGGRLLKRLTNNDE
jgi:hypothetical protein